MFLPYRSFSHRDLTGDLGESISVAWGIVIAVWSKLMVLFFDTCFVITRKMHLWPLYPV